MICNLPNWNCSFLVDPLLDENRLIFPKLVTGHYQLLHMIAQF